MDVARARERFARLRREAGLDPCAIHTPYLINLASADPKIAAGSLNLLRNDLAVAARGGMRFVNTHLGSYGARDRDEGFPAICRALETALTEIEPGVFLVFENSAGAGNLAGGTLEELGAFVRSLGASAARRLPRYGARLGIGLCDRHKAGVDRFVEQAEREIGVDRILMFHFNDTQVELGASRDRHWHIGEGQIGFEGFRALLAHPELREKTAILETPGNDEDDAREHADHFGDRAWRLAS